MKSTVTTLSPDKVKKVKRFLEAQERLQAFKSEHYEIFQEFTQHLQEYNEALEDADKEVRAKGINCGPFSVCGEQVKIDVEKLYDELGEEDFLKAGGTVETRKVYEIDKKKFESLAESGAVPQEVVDSCYSRSFKFKAPAKATLP